MNILKKFNDYFESIYEALNNPQDINWEINNENEMCGYFKIDNFDYKIETKRQIGNNWSFSFFYLNEEKWETNLKNDGKATFRVLATIKSSMFFLYDNKNPNSIIFSTIDDNDTRKRLYLVFCDEFCKSKKWTLSNRGTDIYQLFVMFNDELDESDKLEMFDSVKKVIEEGK